jgi:hypothetical protein
VPFSFKFAGDTLGRIHSFVENGRSAASKLHANRRKAARQAYQLRRAGDAARQYGWLNNTRLGRALVNSREGRGIPVIGRAYQGRATRATQRATLAAGETGQLPNAKTIEHDDNALVALTNRGDFQRTWREIQENARLNGGDMADEAAQTEARAAIGRARSAIGFGQAQAIYAARQRAVTGTGYGSADQLQRTIAQVAAGNESVRSSLAGDINSITKQVGRHDLAGGYSQIRNMSDLYDRFNRGDQSPELLQQIATGERQNAIAGWGSGYLGQHATDKPQDMRASIDTFSRILNDPHSQQEEDAALKFFSEIQTLQGNPYITDGVHDEINKALESPVGIRAKTRMGDLRTAAGVDALGKLTPTNYDPVARTRYQRLQTSIRRADMRPPTDNTGAPNPAGGDPAGPNPAGGGPAGP